MPGIPIDEVRRRIEAAARRAGRDPGGITLLAVTKSAGPEVLPELVRRGVLDVGENRVQDALEKAAEAPRELRWHLIGHLQTNKARKAVTLFRTVHSVDSMKVAQALSDEATRAGVELDAYVEINSGESQKSGLAPAQLEPFLLQAKALPRLRWRGLMTMAPFSDEPEESRPHFRRLRELRDRVGLEGLSMGMTQDFEVAIEEGATIVRVGRALFG